MSTILAPLLSYVFVTTFTPGPNNITSAAYGMRHGYRGTLRYLAGIFVGFVAIMAICAALTELLTTFLPRAESILRVVGALYMLWLAVALFLPSGHKTAAATDPTFVRGMLLQLANPKVIFYGLSVYSGYLGPVLRGPVALGASSVFLALVSFASVSLWTAFGSLFRRLLDRVWARLLFNGVMALLLVYSALSVAGIHLGRP